jgi:hypothetical protein
MSKWIDKDAFGKFQEQKKEEKTQKTNFGIRRSDIVWATPEKGTETVAKEYILRFLMDSSNQFYVQYYYHMYRIGEKWFFSLCPKTWDFEAYCPECSVTQKLWMGTAADKKAANNYKRKRKYVGNAFIVKDPRDENLEEEDRATGKVKLYEFPNKVEMKLKEELTDADEGLGPRIFDPGKDGHNFILKVLSTKPNQEGDTWPDYAQSLFSRKSSAIGTDKEITEIMNQRHDITEYIKSLKKSDDEIEKALKDEMVFDLVKDEWAKIKKKEDESDSNGIATKAAESLKTEDDIDDSKFETPVEEKQEEKEPDLPWDDENEEKGSDSEAKTDLDQSDEDLLAELEDL